jgi:hypothetical protein
VQLAKTCAELERSHRKRKLLQEGSRLGSVVLQRMGVNLQEVTDPTHTCVPRNLVQNG